MAFDLLITNGRVVDGSGEPAFQADVAVKDGRIVGVGKYNGAAAERTIDAEGRVVAPGFIDHHTHFDPQAVWDPYCGSWLHNGHTTVIVAHCGQGIATARSAFRLRRRIAAIPPGCPTTQSAGRSPACSANSAPASSRSPAARLAVPSRRARSPASWRRAPAGRRSTT